MPTKKITRRWLYNSFLVILIFLSLIIIAFSLAIRSYYYNSVLTVVRNTASVQNASLVNYSEDNTVDFSASVRTLVENFADKDRMELMAIDKNGTVIITSSGFSPSGDLEMPTMRRRFPARPATPTPTTPSTARACWPTLCLRPAWTTPTSPRCGMSSR